MFSIIELFGKTVIITDETGYELLCKDKGTDISLDYFSCGHFVYGPKDLPMCPICLEKGLFTYSVATKVPKEILN
jgi:hypothetical protein